MAWTDQCKIAFKTNADALLWKQKKRKGITKILKKLSTESGIPFKTLERWYYEKEKEKEVSLKNGGNEEVVENNTNNEETNSSISSIPICIHCNKKEVYLDNYSKKPLSENSIYFGLCNTCKARKERIGNPKKPHHKKIIQNQTICPKCHHMFFLNDKGDKNE